MPIYDFACACGKAKNDVILKITHTKEDVPFCDCGERMVKQFSRANAIFKGRGFHCNEYNAPTRGF